MSVIEDTRKLIQDFLAPELRSIAVRLDALEARMDERFKTQDWRMSSAEQVASDRHAQLMQAIARLADVYELKERVARIEGRERAG